MRWPDALVATILRRQSLEEVLDMIDQHTLDPVWGFLSEPVVDVFRLNLALEGL